MSRCSLLPCSTPPFRVVPTCASSINHLPLLLTWDTTCWDHRLHSPRAFPLLICQFISIFDDRFSAFFAQACTAFHRETFKNHLPRKAASFILHFRLSREALKTL